MRRVRRMPGRAGAIGVAIAACAACAAMAVAAAGPSAAELPPPVSPQPSSSSSSSPSPQPSGSPLPPLLGHVYANAFCDRFVARFDAAARTMVAGDLQLDEATYALRSYEGDFSRLDGVRAGWGDRLRLIAALKTLLVTIPKTQAAVDDLRRQAAAAADSQQRADLEDSAARLQASVDHQRVIAWELQDLVTLMLDQHASSDTIVGAAKGMVDPGQTIGADALDAPVPHPGDAFAPTEPASASAPSSIEIVLRMPRDRAEIGAAETAAAAAAARIVRTCVQVPSPR